MLLLWTSAVHERKGDACAILDLIDLHTEGASFVSAMRRDPYHAERSPRRHHNGFAKAGVTQWSGPGAGPRRGFVVPRDRGVGPTRAHCSPDRLRQRRETASLTLRHWPASRHPLAACVTWRLSARTSRSARPSGPRRVAFGRIREIARTIRTHPVFLSGSVTSRRIALHHARIDRERPARNSR